MIKTLYLVLIKFILRVHNYSYRIASILVKKLEKDHLHPKHRIMSYHQFFVDNIEPNDTVLDIGCGKGELTFDLAKKAKNVVGVDFNEKSINLAKNKFSAFNIKYFLGDVTKDLPDQKFDVLVLSNVLEHIENRIEFLNKIKKLGNKILIRAPMINRDWITLYKKELGLEWRLNRGHFTEYTLESFKKEIEQAGLFIQDYSVQFGEIWAVIKKYEQ